MRDFKPHPHRPHHPAILQTRQEECVEHTMSNCPGNHKGGNSAFLRRSQSSTISQRFERTLICQTFGFEPPTGRGRREFDIVWLVCAHWSGGGEQGTRYGREGVHHAYLGCQAPITSAAVHGNGGARPSIGGRRRAGKCATQAWMMNNSATGQERLCESPLHHGASRRVLCWNARVCTASVGSIGV